jgi:hypothetical protein
LTDEQQISMVGRLRHSTNDASRSGLSDNYVVASPPLVQPIDRTGTPACGTAQECRRFWSVGDYSFDDNGDDTCCLDHVAYTTIR